MDPKASKGTQEEQSTFSAVKKHYDMSSSDLQTRTADFDKKDILFRSHIVTKNWPYHSVVFDPRIFTILTEKVARQFANKPRGRMLPRESGDAIGAHVNTELLNFQWDANERVDNQTMLAKWAMMDMNARKYGASFGLAKWHYEKSHGKCVYDGPNFKPWANRDVLVDPSHPTIKNWIQLRSYVTIEELQNTNDASRSKPVYKNLDILKDSVKNAMKSGEGRARNYTVKNLDIKGLSDTLGQDEVFKTIEIITEYRNDRWITFAPRHGVIIRDIPNPYEHGQIPVIMLKYYPVDDDIYGLSEIEPLERLQLAINAYINQNLDALNLSTYTPLKVRKGAGAVELHTLVFDQGAKWLMENPSSDVVAHNQQSVGVAEFSTVYRIMVAALQEAAGETSAQASNQVPGSGEKTATEVRDLAYSRNARDNFNQIFLAEAMKKQMMLWFKMNQQFLFNANESNKVIRIVGKDAIRFFQQMGLDSFGIDESPALADPDMADTFSPSDFKKPLFPVTIGGKLKTKFEMEPGGDYGRLTIDKEDLSGDYDYIPDVGSMGSNASELEIGAKGDFMARVTGVDPKTGQPTGIGAMLAQEGKRIKASELLIDYAQAIGFKEADQYLADIKKDEQPQVLPGQPADPTAQVAQQAPVIEGI